MISIQTFNPLLKYALLHVSEVQREIDTLKRLEKTLNGMVEALIGGRRIRYFIADLPCPRRPSA